jgi:hypothetical protein
MSRPTALVSCVPIYRPIQEYSPSLGSMSYHTEASGSSKSSASTPASCSHQLVVHNSFSPNAPDTTKPPDSGTELQSESQTALEHPSNFMTNAAIGCGLLTYRHDTAASGRCSDHTVMAKDAGSYSSTSTIEQGGLNTTPSSATSYAYTTPYSIETPSQFSYPGSAPYIYTPYSYPPIPIGSMEISSQRIPFSPMLPRGPGISQYSYLPHTPSPIPNQHASTSKLVPSDKGPSDRSRRRTNGRKHPGHSHSADFGIDFRYRNQGLPQNVASTPEPSLHTTPQIEGYQHWVNSASLMEPFQRPIAPGNEQLSRSSNLLTAGAHQRSQSDTSHSRPTATTARCARALVIKYSEKEGRRLAFPETVEPSTAPHNLGSISRPRKGSPSGQSVTDSSSPPITPLSHPDTQAVRVVGIKALEVNVDGRAVINIRNALQSDLDWLEPARACYDEPNGCEQGFSQISLSTPINCRDPGLDDLTLSTRKRKRLLKFTKEGTDALLDSKQRGAPLAKHAPISQVFGYGRLATREHLARQFLGLSSINHEDNATLPLVRQNNAEQKGNICSTKGNPEADTHHTVPHWPDDRFPWAEDTAERKHREVREAEHESRTRRACIERYLEDDKFDNSLDGDSRSALKLIMTKRGVTSSTSADAREAILHASRIRHRRNSRENVVQIISPSEETGCFCEGKNEEGGGMVCCDGCSIWYHLSCCGIHTEDDLDDQWFCTRCSEPRTYPKVEATASPVDRVPVTPKLQYTTGPSLSATDETTRTYHAHTSDAALAPSPNFSATGKFSISLLDTPAFYASPRAPSGSSAYSKNTPSTPLLQPRMRIVSYAEHYNVCQTPGAPDSDYKKIYSTPKFEDFFDSGGIQSGSTPATRNLASPTPLQRHRLSGHGHPAFVTPSSSQNFLRSLQGGSTPALESSSSPGGPGYSPLPVSPMLTSSRTTYPSVNDSISPSPYRGHPRQVSFGTRATSFTASASSLRDSTTISGLAKPPHLGLDNPRECKDENVIKGADLEFGAGTYLVRYSLVVLTWN